MDLTAVSRKYTVLGSVFTVALALLSTAVPFLAPFAGAALAVVILNSKKPWLPAALGAGVTAAVWGLSSFMGGIYLFAAVTLMIAVTAATLSVAFGRAKPIKSVIIATSVTLGASLVALGLAYVYFEGGSLSADGVKAAFAWITEGIDSTAKNFLDSLGKEADAETVKLYENFFESFKNSVTEYYLPMSPSLCVYFAFLTVTPAVLFVKNAVPACDVAKVGRFGSMRTQRLFAVLMAAAYIASLFMSDDTVGLTVRNLTVASMGYFVAAGYSVISFFLTARGTRPPAKYLIYILTAFVCVLTLGFDIIAMLGIVEGLLQIRKKFDLVAAKYGEKGENIRDMMERLKDAEQEKPENDVPWYERKKEEDKDKKDDGSDNDGGEEK